MAWVPIAAGGKGTLLGKKKKPLSPKRQGHSLCGTTLICRRPYGTGPLMPHTMGRRSNARHTSALTEKGSAGGSEVIFLRFRPPPFTKRRLSLRHSRTTLPHLRRNCSILLVSYPLTPGLSTPNGAFFHLLPMSGSDAFCTGHRRPQPPLWTGPWPEEKSRTGGRRDPGWHHP